MGLTQDVPSVSKVAKGLMRVHMTGVKPMAVEIARTRSLFGGFNITNNYFI
jgi:hypothetical protein